MYEWAVIMARIERYLAVEGRVVEIDRSNAESFYIGARNSTGGWDVEIDVDLVLEGFQQGMSEFVNELEEEGLL